MKSRTALVLFLVSLYLPFQCAEEQLEVNAGYWMSGIPISEIQSTLFTRLIFAQAYIHNASFEVLIPKSDERNLFAFSSQVKEKNPSIKTLVTIWGKETYTSMVNDSSSRSSFIRSSLDVARVHGFDGLDLYWDFPQEQFEMDGMATLLQEWRRYVDDHYPELILTATVPYSPYWPFNKSIYPTEAMGTNLDWVHLKTYSYINWRPQVTAAHSALYDPSSIYSTDFGINHWILRGLMPRKMVLGLAFFGYAWNLTDPGNKTIGASATDRAQTEHGLGLMTYKEIKDQISSCEGNALYNDTYKIYYWSCGSTWIGFDDVETIKTKVSYAKEHNLRGYMAWEVSYDDNWLLSRAGNFS